jgi:hypothetical protein
LQKIHDRVATVLNFRYGLGKFALAEKNGRFGARVHHKYVRPELLKAPGKFFAVCMLGDKSEEVQVALRIAHDTIEIIDLKQA